MNAILHLCDVFAKKKKGFTHTTKTTKLIIKDDQKYFKRLNAQDYA